MTAELESCLSGEAAFQRCFIDGLFRVMREPDLGAFILVCANAFHDATVQASLGEALAERYQALREEHFTALAAGRDPVGAPDDLMVFYKLCLLGLENIQATESRQIGPWQVQFNHLRSFRPRRMAGAAPSTLSLPFDPAGFHFNKPFMARELFAGGELAGRSADLYFNKFPFAEGHLLLVPERQSETPQFLDQGDFFWAWRVMETAGLPGLRLGYNALGAYASVNHFHIQLAVQKKPLPVEDGRWAHNGGSEPYPANCISYADPEMAWQAIASRLEPYNLLWLPGRVLLFPRRWQGTEERPAWTGGFAWFEMAGGLVTFNRDNYRELDDAAIRRALATAGNGGQAA